MKSTVVEIRANSEDPRKVDFYADGRIITNIIAERVFNASGKLTARAVIRYDKKTKTKTAAAGSVEETIINGDEAS